MKRRYPQVNCEYHSWFKYADKNGSGLIEPELYIELKDRVILFEMKLTGGHAGRMQLEGLYKPVLEWVFKKPVYCLLVCRWVTPDTPGPFFSSPDDFMMSGEGFGTWHWLP